MSPSDFELVASAIESIATAVALIAGGAWALWRFVLQGEHVARLEFDLDLRIIGQQGNKIMVELAAVIENKGKVRHWIKNFYFNLYSMEPTDPVRASDGQFNGQVVFGRQLQKERYWIPENWERSFIEPGVKQRYTFNTAIPRKSTSILLYSEFRYSDEERGFHTAQRIFPILVQSPKNPSRR